MPEEEKNIDNSLQNTESSETDKELEEYIQQVDALYESISNEKISIQELQNELQNFQENIKNSRIEEKDKSEISELLNNIDYKKEREDLMIEVQNILELLHKLVNKNLQALKNEVINNSQEQEGCRSPEVKKGIELAQNEFNDTVEDATNDINPVASKIGSRIQNLIG